MEDVRDFLAVGDVLLVSSMLLRNIPHISDRPGVGVDTRD